MNRKLKNCIIEIEIFCNIINVFTVTSDQFNASLLNKAKWMQPLHVSV